MALASDDFDDLLESIAGTSTAAAQLVGILGSIPTTATAAGQAARTAAGGLDAMGDAAAKASAAQRAATAAGAASVQGATASAKANDALDGSLTQVASSSTAAGGALGKVQGILAKLGPYGQAAAIGIGLITIAITAVVAIGGKLLATAIAATQARDRIREALGALQGTGAAGGGVLVAQLDALAKKLPFTATQLQEWARPLLALRATSRDVEGAIKAIAASTALMGEEGGRAAQGLYADFQKLANQRMRVWLSPDVLEKMATAGVSAQALAKELGVTDQKLKYLAVDAKGLGDAMQRILLRQGAGALAAMGQDIDVIRGKVAEGLTSAFEGFGDVMRPFMGEVQRLASEFYKGGVGANVLGAVVRGVLEPAFRYGAAAVRWLHVGILQLTIYGLRAYIALRPLLQWLEQVGVTSFVVTKGFQALQLVAALLAGVLLAVGLAMALVALPFVVAGAAILAVGFAIQYLAGLIGGAVENFDNLKAAVIGGLAGWGDAAVAAAGDLVAGLVQGISSGAGIVADAISGLAKGALGAFKGIFGIKSPSRVMRAHGKRDIAEEGLAAGIDEGADEVDRAMTALATPPKGKGGGVRGGRWSKLADKIEIVFQGRASEFPSFREQAEQWLDEMSASGPEPEAA